MQRLCTKVNVIPVIAKSDALTLEEIAKFKKAVRSFLNIFVIYGFIWVLFFN